MHTERPARESSGLEGLPNYTEPTQEVEGKPQWLVCTNLPFHVQIQVQIKGITTYQFGSDALYIFQKNTDLISNCPNYPFCDHFSSILNKCSGDSTFVRVWEQETTFLWPQYYFLNHYFIVTQHEI